MLKSASNSINNIIERIFGLRIQPSSETRLAATRNSILQKLAISLVIDVGANRGQWSSRIRSDGYRGEIWSFEPTDAFLELKKNVNNDQNWKIFNLALADKAGESEMFLSSNQGLSSSLLEPTGFRSQHPTISFSETRKVNVSTLDSKIEVSSPPFYLKIDTQGSESLVLEGASKSLSKCLAVEFESALIPLYRNESLHYELARKLFYLGFTPAQVVITHWDSNLKSVSMDSIFIREEDK